MYPRAYSIKTPSTPRAIRLKATMPNVHWLPNPVCTIAVGVGVLVTTTGGDVGAGVAVATAGVGVGVVMGATVQSSVEPEPEAINLNFIFANVPVPDFAERFVPVRVTTVALGLAETLLKKSPGVVETYCKY